MKIIEVKPTIFPEVKIIRYQRFADERGYFTETFRQQQWLQAVDNFKIEQINESHSKPNVFRGLHLQYQPAMGKIVRVVEDEVYDFFLDLRPHSKNFGKLGVYHLVEDKTQAIGEWIYLPFGFAHGVYFPSGGTIEYLCNASWNPNGELSVSIFDQTIDWSLIDPKIKKIFFEEKEQLIISEKDKQGVSLEKAKDILVQFVQ
jgi:dTDP-4-dehydrorhamnose 3,5-epimerase